MHLSESKEFIKTLQLSFCKAQLTANDCVIELTRNNLNITHKLTEQDLTSLFNKTVIAFKRDNSQSFSLLKIPVNKYELRTLTSKFNSFSSINIFSEFINSVSPSIFCLQVDSHILPPLQFAAIINSFLKTTHISASSSISIYDTLDINWDSQQLFNSSPDLEPDYSLYQPLIQDVTPEPAKPPIPLSNRFSILGTLSQSLNFSQLFKMFPTTSQPDDSSSSSESDSSDEESDDTSDESSTPADIEYEPLIEEQAASEEDKDYFKNHYTHFQGQQEFHMQSISNEAIDESEDEESNEVDDNCDADAVKSDDDADADVKSDDDEDDVKSDDDDVKSDDDEDADDEKSNDADADDAVDAAAADDDDVDDDNAAVADDNAAVADDDADADDAADDAAADAADNAADDADDDADDKKSDDDKENEEEVKDEEEDEAKDEEQEKIRKSWLINRIRKGVDELKSSKFFEYLKEKSTKKVIIESSPLGSIAEEQCEKSLPIKRNNLIVLNPLTESEESVWQIV